MKNIKMKIIVADWDKVTSPRRDENEEKAMEKGAEYVCGCCGKEIKDPAKAKSLHLIDGGDYWTECDISTDDGRDVGWWTVGPTCYNKFKKNSYEIEYEFENVVEE